MVPAHRLMFGRNIWLGKLCGSASDGADFIKRRSHRRANTHRLGFDGCGVHSLMCQPPSPHHHLNTQISMKGS